MVNFLKVSHFAGVFGQSFGVRTQSGDEEKNFLTFLGSGGGRISRLSSVGIFFIIQDICLLNEIVWFELDEAGK